MNLSVALLVLLALILNLTTVFASPLRQLIQSKLESEYRDIKPEGSRCGISRGPSSFYYGTC